MVTGLRGRGGFEVGMAWAGGKLTKATILNPYGNDIQQVMVQGKEVDPHSDPRFTIVMRKHSG